MSTPWWHRQLDGLSDQFRVVALDPRAYGESDKVVYGHRMARHAADLRDLLDHIGVHDAVAVGWSLGANVLLSHWELFAGRNLVGAVHVDQSAYCLNRAGWKLGFGTEEQAKEFLKGFREAPAEGARALVELCLTEPPADDDLRWMVDELLKTPVEQALTLEFDHLWSDWRDIVPTVGLPVLVATGRQSKVFPWQSGQWIAEQLPAGQHHIFEHSGHCPHLEEADAFNDAVRAFAGPLAARGGARA